MYGGLGGFSECKYEFMRCTKVVFPEPAIPIVMITLGFPFVEGGIPLEDDDPLACAAEPDVEAIVNVEDKVRREAARRAQVETSC